MRISFIYNSDLAKKAHKQQYVTSLTDIQSLLYITGMLPNISPDINQLYKIPQTSNKPIKRGKVITPPDMSWITTTNISQWFIHSMNKTPKDIQAISVRSFCVLLKCVTVYWCCLFYNITSIYIAIRASIILQVCFT